MLAGCSRSAAAALIAEGSVQLDGEPQRQRSARVHAGMCVRFEPPPAEHHALTPDPSIVPPIVHVDTDFVVVDKPAGMIVHPGAGRPDKTLVNGLLALFPEIATVGEPGRPGIVHRLDGDTSGLLVVARTGPAYKRLVKALAERSVERVYSAIVYGVVSDDRGVIDAPIGRSTQRRTRMAIVADGREARTHYTVDARRFEEPQASLLTCRLETGRTHQIRVHLAAIGHPVVGDPTYGRRVQPIEFGRVALHARSLGFDHPSTGDRVAFEAGPPRDFSELAESLGLVGETPAG
jgi:23S rRNA pseudouridine1911/1915/1917 synthase